MDLHGLIASGSYASIFILMTANGIINFPSSQILYLIVGYFVSAEKLTLSGSIIAGTLGNTLGNIIAFLLVKKYEGPLARKLLMLPQEQFTKIHRALHETFNDRGMIWLFIGKLTPSVKAFVPVVAGLAQTKTTLTSVIFFAASLVWASIIIYLGYAFGEHVTLSSFLTVSFIVGAIVIFVLYRNISKKLER